MSDRPTFSAALAVVLSVSTSNKLLIEHLNSLVFEARGKDIQVGSDTPVPGTPGTSPPLSKGQRNLMALQKAAVSYSNAVRHIVYTHGGD